MNGMHQYAEDTQTVPASWAMPVAIIRAENQDFGPQRATQQAIDPFKIGPANSIEIVARIQATLVTGAFVKNANVASVAIAATGLGSSYGDLATRSIASKIIGIWEPSGSSTMPAMVAELTRMATPTPNLFAGFGRYTNANWDGYNADPILPATLDAARKFVQMLPQTFGYPDVAPGSDGTVGLEWVFSNKPLRKLFIDIGPNAIWSGYWRRATGETQTMPTQSIDLTTKASLATLFKKLNS